MRRLQPYKRAQDCEFCSCHEELRRPGSQQLGRESVRLWTVLT
uniref:Macaca fascicularis brain cDNA clone: QccE-17811, similar to human RIC3 protein (RIC3), mRNA, RefSeq: NM_024557.2 n=1 Tax=Macaca fascicularis TaxID=9541 RepID=I7GHQ6_MACFA|nr:unnamed protein product [Macaca fascicularis]